MLPTKNKESGFLVCNLCNQTKSITEEIKNSYNFSKKISHPKGKEFKNLKEMEQWKTKEIYKKFRNKISNKEEKYSK